MTIAKFEVISLINDIKSVYLLLNIYNSTLRISLMIKKDIKFFQRLNFYFVISNNF
jgi:hypothetical protein